MNPNTAPHHTRSIGIILLVISLFTGLLGMGMTMPAPEAQAANLTMSSDMIDSFTAKIHRTDMPAGEYEDLADGATVSVYDTIRWQLGFTIPAGTLSETNTTVQTYLELDGSRDNWGNAQPNLYGTWIGTIMVNGEQAGDYQIRILNPNYDGNDNYEVHTGYYPPLKDNLYRYRIRIRFTFNKEFINRNQTMPINDGTLWFDQDAYWLGGDGTAPSVGIGTHTMRFTVQGMHATLDKEAVGEPAYNPKTGLVEQRWKVTVVNDGSMDLPSGWKLADTMYKNDAPASIRDNRGSVASGGFACALSTKAGNTCSQSYPSSLVQPAITGYRPESYSVRSGTQYWFFMGSDGAFDATLNKPYYNASALSLGNLANIYYNSEMWTMDTLKAGDTIVYEYTSHSPWSADYDHVTNRVILHPNSKYYPEILSDTAQYAMPDKDEGTPYLQTSKSFGSSKPIGDCLEGTDGCLMQSTWKTVITNTGDGDQQPPWQVVDQLNRSSISDNPCSAGSKYSWFRAEDVQQMIDNLKAQGFDAELDAVETCTANTGETIPANGWHDVDDLADLNGLYESRSVVGTKLRINTVLKAGGTISIEYNSTSQGHGYTGERRYDNAAQACSWINDNWVCYPGTSTSNVRTIQQLRKGCGGYYGDGSSYSTNIYDGKRWWLGLETEQATHKAELGSCGIKADIAPADRGKPVTFHETMTTHASRSNGIPKGFTLVGSDNRQCNPNNTNNATCWGIEAPTTIGQQASKSVNNGNTTVTITKTGEGEWDITFHTPEQNNNYWSSILFYVVYQNKDFDETSWKDVNQFGRIEHSIGGNNKVHATVQNGVMDLTASDYWWHYHYDNGSVTAAKTKTSHAPEGASGTKVAYKTGFNPNAIDLNPDGATVSLTDTVTGLTDKDTVALMPSSVVVKYLSEPQTQSLSWNYGGNWGNPGSLHGKNNGYGYYYTYSNIPSTPPSNARTLAPSMYTASWDAATSTLTVDGLPDNARIWVEYALVYNSVNTQLSNIRNTAMLTVDGQPVEAISKATTTNTFPIYKSAAVAKIQGVYLKKTDSANSTLVLADAVFDLQRWDGTQYVHDRTITTSSTAASVVDKLECGTAYRLTETQAPVDYNLDSTPYEFALKACEAPTGFKPDGWHGVEHITMDTITRTNQRIPVKHTMPTTGQGLILILLLSVSLTTMIGGIIILARTSRR
jgi:hypothetical protein